MADAEGDTNLEDVLAAFTFGDEDEGADAGEPAASAGESMVQRHAREKVELRERVRAMKKAAGKAERAAVAIQIGQLENELLERHARERDAGADASEDGQRKVKGKSQQRRAKKQREEAEREARMAEARQNAGPDRRAEEDAALRAQLAPLGLGVREVAADGHCLFRAVACQLETPKAAATDDAPVWDLRRRAVEHARAHAPDFEPFFEPTDTAPTFEAYCKEMASTAAWGGQMEIRALATVLGRPIRVHTVGAPPLVMSDGSAAAQSTPTIELAFHQHAFGLGEHYNAVQPLDEQ